MRIDGYTQLKIDNEGYTFHSRHLTKALAWEAAQKAQSQGNYTMIAYDYDASEHLLFVRPVPKNTH